MQISVNAVCAVLLAGSLCACQTANTGSSTHGVAPVSAKKPVNRAFQNEAASSAIKPAARTKAAVVRRATTKPKPKTERVIVNEARSSAIKPVRRTARSVPKKFAKRSGKTARSSRAGKNYDHLISKYAKANGVPISLARAVVKVESNFRPRARGAAGEVGLMQIKPATARGMGYRGSTKGLYGPETNIKYGMKYLGGAYRKGGRNTCGAILKYNAGHGARRWNKTSRAYCKKVKRILGKV
ncbi:MAG: transglycosylase SLT domain-containing protein [Pseudomonadota bacterium]